MIPSRRKPVLRLALLGLVAVVSVASSGVLQMRLTATSSHRYAGFMDSSTTYNNVHANFVVPTITCGGEVSFWTGIGSNGNYLVQTGVDVTCSGGVTTYYGWVESWTGGSYPAYHASYANVVAPGDSMTSVTHNNGNGCFTATLTNHTRGWTRAPQLCIGTGHATMAEVFIENNTSCLADFHAVHFTDVTVNGTAMGNTTHTKYNMTDSSGSYKATTSDFLSGSNGYNFNISWVRCS